MDDLISRHPEERTDNRTETHARDLLPPADTDLSAYSDKLWRAAYERGKKEAEAERKRGEWTKDNGCPFCGFQPWYERDIHTLSFCPNCGADMRGEQDEGTEYI